MTTTVEEVTNAVNEPVPLADHLSYSAISSAWKCLKAYQLERVLGLPRTPSYSLAGGRAFHAVTEAYDRQLYSST